MKTHTHKQPSLIRLILAFPLAVLALALLGLLCYREARAAYTDPHPDAIDV